MKAVLFPLISKNTFGRIYIFFSVVVALPIFLLPEGNKQWMALSLKIIELFRGIQLNWETSTFPTAAVISYFLVLILAFLLAVLFCFTKIDMDAGNRVLRKKLSVSSRVIRTLGIFVIVLLCYFQNTPPPSISWRWDFILNFVYKNKFLYFIYMEGFLGCFALFWFYVFAEIINLLKFIARRDHD